MLGGTAQLVVEVGLGLKKDVVSRLQSGIGLERRELAVAQAEDRAPPWSKKATTDERGGVPRKRGQDGHGGGYGDNRIRSG